MNGERISYAGKRIYIGLDVHRAFFVAAWILPGKSRGLLRPHREEHEISQKWNSYNFSQTK